jgi:hypothetical protein
MDTIKRKVREENLADRASSRPAAIPPSRRPLTSPSPTADPPTIMARISSVKAEGLLNRLGFGFGSSSTSSTSAIPGFSSSSSKLLSSSTTGA